MEMKIFCDTLSSIIRALNIETPKCRKEENHKEQQKNEGNE